MNRKAISLICIFYFAVIISSGTIVLFQQDISIEMLYQNGSSSSPSQDFHWSWSRSSHVVTNLNQYNKLFNENNSENYPISVDFEKETIIAVFCSSNHGLLDIVKITSSLIGVNVFINEPADLEGRDVNILLFNVVKVNMRISEKSNINFLWISI